MDNPRDACTQFTNEEVDRMLSRAEKAEAEVKRLQSLSLTCCSCKKVLADLEELKSHIVACPDHPITQYVQQERQDIIKILEERAASYDEFSKLDYLVPDALERYRYCANLLRDMVTTIKQRRI